MKKPLLLLLAFTPLIPSCNKKWSFTNPFPNDKYQKIGFAFADNEKINRQLTTTERNMVSSTIEESDKYDEKIYSMVSEKHTRNYIRAFAGEFKEGYSAANILKDETVTAIRQDESVNPDKKERKKITSQSKMTSNYAYGNIEEDIEENSYTYLAKLDDPEISSYKEADNFVSCDSLNIRTQKIINKKYKTCSDSGEIVKHSEGKSWSEITEDEKKLFIDQIFIRQSSYITAPDSKSGADNDNNIILYVASQNKHKDEETGKLGTFTLKDGRSYQAMDNSLTVTKLQPMTDTSEKKNWCLVSYVRVYTETVITSDVIEPNVPVEKLKDPITISFTEEISKFSLDKKDISESIPEVTI